MAHPPLKTLQSTPGEPLILVGKQIGITVIPPQTPLTGLHYFDGKFLRANDLETEQRYVRHLVGLSNQADGAGIAHGFDVSLGGGDTLQVGPGLAIDPAGRVLLLPVATSVQLQELIERSQELRRLKTPATVMRGQGFEACEVVGAVPPDNVPRGGDLYLITIAYAEALCGEEDVYGKLCEEACVTSTDRPYRVEGIVVRAVPLLLHTPFITSSAVALDRTHLRSLVASAYFTDERNRVASLISRAGLQAPTWCFGAEAVGGSDVPIAVVARAGMSTIFLDAWIARRERIDTPAKRYWQWRMAMRPWDVYLAQILQFECQLHELFQKVPDPGAIDDPCKDERTIIRDASQTMEELIQFYTEVSNRLVRLRELPVSDITTDLPALRGGLTALQDLQARLTSKAQPDFVDRILIRGGIVETPSAGYLPVVPSSTVTVNTQVRRLLGEGVDLRFCVVRPDYIPHALEEAQHMERISLLQGLDNPQAKPRVDVLVPDGHIQEQQTRPGGQGYEMTLDLKGTGFSLLEAIFAEPDEPRSLTRFQSAVANPSRPSISFFGAARGEALSTGGTGFHFAGLSTTKEPDPGTIRGPLSNFFSTQLLTVRQPFTATTFATPRSATSAGAAPRAPIQPGAAGLAGERPIARLLLERLGSFTNIQLRSTLQASNAMWMTMETVADPFALHRHETTRVAGEMVFIFPTPGEEETFVVEIRFSGDLQLDERLPETGTELSIKTHVIGPLSGRVIISPGGQEALPTVHISEEVVLVRRRMPGERAEVQVIFPKFGLVPQLRVQVDLRVYRQWTSATEAEAQGAIRLLHQLQRINATPSKNPDVPLFTASQKENPDVLIPGHVAHEAAITALRRLAALLDDPRFDDIASRRLFPPPRPIPTEVIIHATRDWVLFHRRRDIQCSQDVVPPEVLQRRYRIYHVHVAALEERELLNRALLANDGQTIDRFGPQPVTVVEFGPGIQTLQSVPEHVRADWAMRITPGAEIIYGGIASQGEAFEEGQALALARLGSLSDVLDSVTQVQPDAVFISLPRVPDILVAGVNDGIMLLATVDIPTICHEVYRLDISTTSLAEFLRAVASDNTTDITAVLNQFALQRLGRVQFKQGTSTVFMNTTEEVVKAWPEAGNGPVRAVVAISQRPEPFPPTPEDEAQIQRYQAQASTISDAIGGNVQPSEVSHTPTFADVVPCPVITVIVSEPRIETVCNELLFFPNATTPTILRQLVRSIEQTGLPDEFIRQAPRLSRVAVDFEIPANTPVAGFQDEFTQFWKSELPRGLPQGLQLHFIAVSPQGTTTDEHTTHVNQSHRLATDSRDILGREIEVHNVINGAQILPTQCGALTLAIPVRADDFSFVPGFIVDRGQPIASGRPDLGFRFTPSGELIRDEAFQLAVETLKAARVTIERVELAGETEAAAIDPRLETLFQALQDEGLVSEETERMPMILSETERPVLNQGGLLLDHVFVFRRG